MNSLNNASSLDRATTGALSMSMDMDVGRASNSVYFPVSSTAAPMASQARNVSLTSTSNEDIDKESAALALSALAGSKRTHSPTCVSDSASLPPQAQSQGNSTAGNINGNANANANGIVTPYDNAKRIKSSHPMNMNHNHHSQSQSQSQIHHLAPVTVTAVATPQSHSSTGSYNINMHCPESANRQHHFAHMQQRMQYLDNAMPMPGSHYVSSPTVTSHATPVSSTIQSNRISDNAVTITATAAAALIAKVTSHDSPITTPSQLQTHGQTSAQSLSIIPPNQQLLPDGSYKRKDKSLGVLCVNFMMRYNTIKLQNPHITPAISIDEASKYLAVERRRIYDIINILEAIQVVSRKCKNTYNWHGMDGVTQTFFELQKDAMVCFEEDAVRNGFKEMMEKKVEHAVVVVEEKKEEPIMPLGLAMLLAGAEQVDQKAAKTKKKPANKEKSLGRLSQKFIQLFLCGNETIALTDASDKILGKTLLPEASSGATATEIIKARNAANKVMKTKIRRLYDIANVMSSIGLIAKLNGGNNMSNMARNRPSFKWTYPVSAAQIMEIGKAKEGAPIVAAPFMPVPSVAYRTSSSDDVHV